MPRREEDATSDESPDDASTKSKKAEQVASIREVFSFARTRRVKVYITGAFMCAVVSGCIMPAMAFFFAKAFENLGAATDASSFLGGIRNVAFSFMILGAIILLSMTVQTMLMETAAGEMTREMKNSWFRALLRQDMAYHDIRDVPGQATLITANGSRFRKGVGRKLSEAVQFFIACLGSLAYSFWSSWQVTLALLAVAPVLYFSTMCIIKITTSQTARTNECYSKAGSVVSTCVHSIRTILSLNALEDMVERYTSATEEACDSARSNASSLGLANGFQFVSMLLAYVMVTLFGSFLLYRNVRENGCDPSNTVEGAIPCDPSGMGVYGSLMGVSIAASVLPQVSIALEKFSGARSACYPALVAMNRTLEDDGESEGKDIEMALNRSSHAMQRELESLPKYAIDCSSPLGFQPETMKGDIEFKNVTFAYPARPDASVLRDFSLKIPAGRTVALVGPSGSGKSTVTALVERFYDPSAGSVTLDGTDLKLLNVKWLREQIGLVMQEPKLFGKSIKENISFGASGVTQEDIERAARLANAHDFIVSFPDGYNTQVGDLGGMLSGGQRQRIAIARVLVRSPKLLILDEATSAMDSVSEAAVQQALDGLLSLRSATTIVIAHRLSTIRNADMIAVVKGGQIVESGTHDELLALNREYAALVKAQKTKATKEDETGSDRGSEHGSLHDSATVDVDLDEDRSSDEVQSPVVFEFKDVHHRYPSRQDVDVFRGLNLSVYRGETLALVGPSGSGKSSVLQLMEHFYQPTQGSVEFLGVDLKRINVRWLRDQIGLVGQESTLFADTVEANIRLGCPDATIDDVIEAARQANCHDFISSFPSGYQTQIGQGGGLISGGQKQRLAIARAILRKPKVLLLDEATSSLDSKSERIVQESLDKIMANREQTVVIIAHRLSTVRNADRIAVIEHGKVREIGTHDQLMLKPNGLYRRLQQLQNLESAGSGFADQEDKLKPGAEGQLAKESVPESTAEELELSDTEASKNSHRAWQIGRKYISYLLVGAVGAVFAGLSMPVWGIMFAYMIELFYRRVGCPPIPEGFDSCDAYFDSEANAMQTLSFQIFYGYLGLVVAAVAGNIALFWGFGSATENMNKEVRDSAFKSLIRQEVAWFDMRAPGTITSQLADDAAMLQAYVGEPIRSLTVSLSSVVVGLILSFVYMWPFALLTLGLIPFLAFGSAMEMRTFMGEDEVTGETQDEHSPGGIAVETLSNIKTVASLTLEAERADEYDLALKHEEPHPLRSNLIKGSLSGTGQCIQMWSFAIMFWFGGYLLLHYPDAFTYKSYLISMFSLFFSMYGLTLAFQGTVDREKAKAAAQRIFTLADRKSLIDPLSDDGVIVLDDGTVEIVQKSDQRTKQLGSSEEQSQCQPVPCYRVWLLVTLAALLGLGAGVGIGYKKS